MQCPKCKAEAMNPPIVFLDKLKWVCGCCGYETTAYILTPDHIEAVRNLEKCHDHACSTTALLKIVGDVIDAFADIPKNETGKNEQENRNEIINT